MRDPSVDKPSITAIVEGKILKGAIENFIGKKKVYLELMIKCYGLEAVRM